MTASPEIVPINFDESTPPAVPNQEVIQLADIHESRRSENLLRPAEAAELTPKQVELFNKYYQLVPAIVFKVGKGLSDSEFEQLCADGYEGLVKAIHSYDYEKASHQESDRGGYIYQMIKGAALKGLLRQFGKDNNGKIARLKPSVIAGTAVSIDNKSAPPQEVTDELIELRSDVAAAVNELEHREREIYVRRYGLEQSQQEIASHVGVSQIHISRLLKRIGEHVRHRLEIEQPKT